MRDKWEKGSIQFDRLYDGSAFECRVPFFGPFLRTKLIQRQEYALRFVKATGARSIVDLGCGTGAFAVRAALQGVAVRGYDISEAAVRIAAARAEKAGVAQQCRFQVADIRRVEFPDADAWVDLGCLQYLPDLSDVLPRVTKIQHLFSGLPMRYHWLNIIRYVYRARLKGNPYRTYTEKEIRSLFSRYESLCLRKDGLQFYISTVDLEKISEPSSV